MNGQRGGLNFSSILSKIAAPSWLDSSVGSTLHRYRKGHGFESRSSLILFVCLFVLFCFVLFLFLCSFFSGTVALVAGTTAMINYVFIQLLLAKTQTYQENPLRK